MSTLVSGDSGGTAVTTTTLPTLQGQVLQVVNYQTGAVATGTTSIPQDDTIPQITEGTQFITLAITPRSATSKLIIQVITCLTASITDNVCTALFQDSTANALAALNTVNSTAGWMMNHSFLHYMTSGTTSSTTFRVRCGPNGGATTVTFNGTAGARLYGGVMPSSITIWEVVP